MGTASGADPELGRRPSSALLCSFLEVASSLSPLGKRYHDLLPLHRLEKEAMEAGDSAKSQAPRFSSSEGYVPLYVFERLRGKVRN